MKFSKILCSALLLTALALPTFADNIGFLDMEKFFSSYKEAKKIQEDINSRRETFKKHVDEHQEKIEAAVKKNKKEDEINMMRRKAEEDVSQEQKKLMQYEMEVQQNLYSRVMGVASQVAKEYGIDVVLDKRVVYAGGFDLTDFVLQKFNK
jgi:Skp family chaperone for outer membrane proteins